MLMRMTIFHRNEKKKASVFSSSKNLNTSMAIFRFYSTFFKHNQITSDEDTEFPNINRKYFDEITGLIGNPKI